MLVSCHDISVALLYVDVATSVQVGVLMSFIPIVRILFLLLASFTLGIS